MRTLYFIISLIISVAATASGTWIWYPGQLAAHFQQIQQQKSAERCVNVGYPGKFEPIWHVTYFKTADKPVITVHSHNNLPALFIKEDNPEKWKASLDSINWMPVEFDSRLNNQNIRPDSNQEIIRPIYFGKGIATNYCPMIVDFGELEVGTVSLLAKGNGVLEFLVGECREEVECKDKSTFEQYPIPEIKLTGEWQHIKLPERAIRYLSINGDAEIDSLCFDTKIWPVQQLMTFNSSDSLLNKLFETGVKTLHTSMHNFYLDGVKRDYLPWAMDAIISALGGDYVFGDRQVARNGIALSLMPHNPKVSDWGIVDYPLHALIGLKQDYLRYGDMSTLNMYRDRIVSQLSLYETNQDDNGFIHAPAGSTGFIPGWSRDNGPNDFGVPAYAQMMLYENFRIAAEFANLWDDKRMKSHYKEKADKLAKSIISKFWDDERKAFINGFYPDGTNDARISHHAQYWSVLTDLYPTEFYDTLFDKVIPSIDKYKTNISYEKGYEALVYQKAGRMEDYYHLISDVWGDWLKQGNIRFPENFSWGASFKKQHEFYGRPFGLSLCHGANGVPPIMLALRGIYGFDQKTSGQYTLNPNLMDLEYAAGKIPIQDGFIEIELHKNSPSWIVVSDNVNIETTKNISIYRHSDFKYPRNPIKIAPYHDNYYIYDMGETLAGKVSLDNREIGKYEIRYCNRLYPGLRGDTAENIAKYGRTGLNVAGQPWFSDQREASICDNENKNSIHVFRYLLISTPEHDGPIPLESITVLTNTF